LPQSLSTPVRPVRLLRHLGLATTPSPLLSEEQSRSPWRMRGFLFNPAGHNTSPRLRKEPHQSLDDSGYNSDRGYNERDGAHHAAAHVGGKRHYGADDTENNCD